MSDDLVKRLRDLGDHASFEPHMHHTAADRIEELEAKLDWVLVERDETFALMLDRAQTAEAKLEKALEALEVIANYECVGDSWRCGSKAALEELTGGKDE